MSVMRYVLTALLAILLLVSPAGAELASGVLHGAPTAEAHQLVSPADVLAQCCERAGHHSSAACASPAWLPPAEPSVLVPEVETEAWVPTQAPAAASREPDIPTEPPRPS